MPKLLVGRTAIAGINLTFSHAGTAVRIAWFPYLLLVVSEVAYYSLIASAAQEFGETYTSAGNHNALAALGQFWHAVDWQTALLFVVSSLAYTLLAVGWIRFVLRGEIVATPRFGVREVKLFFAYVLWTIWLIVVGALIWLIVMATPGLERWIAFSLAIAVAVFAMLSTARLMMLFPMIALSQGMGWIRAWRMTKGNSWRLFAGLLLSFLLAFVITILVSIPLQFLPGEPSLELSVAGVIDIVAQQAISVFLLMVVLGTLAEAYRQLNGPGMVVPEEVLQVFDD